MPLAPPHVLDELLAGRARAVARGELDPLPLRRAATVALLRDAPDGPEAYLVRRVPTMVFAAGRHVFPGGGVDPRDAVPHGPAGPGSAEVGPDASWWASRLGGDEGTARAAVCAAVRETYEEVGVLLAGRDASDVVAAPGGEAWAADRAALLSGELALGELLARRGLRLRADLLAPWARWLTPLFEVRRYDTAFFVATLPTGQEARHDPGEADAGAWVRPADAVAAADAGRTPMLPPTRAVLAELAAYGSVAEALAAAPDRRIEPLLPGWVDEGERVRVVLPGEAAWPGDQPPGSPAASGRPDEHAR